MIKALHWNPAREDEYVDGEVERVDELPNDVPTGSCFRVREDGSFLLMLPDGSWADVTETAEEVTG